MRLPASRWRLLAAIFAAGLLADQATKLLAADRLTSAFERRGARTLGAKLAVLYGGQHLEVDARAPHVVYAPLWRMTYVENPGAAWGLFRDASPRFRNVFFGLVALAAAVFILRAYRKLEERQRWLQVGLALVLTGAAGNVVDRLARSAVIDFVDWYWWNRPDLRWPTFNVADSMLSVGVVMLLLAPSGRKKEEKERPAA
ncbi:MAG TPA: signal peptidase II [Anaeromyxobacteraceae bacterium]|jgi:signal peptidase II